MKIKSLFKKLSSFNFQLSTRKGFTLIELLIVIAVLGVLAAGVLVAIDPFEQLARGRDTGRKSSVTQLGRAIQAYYTANGAYLDATVWNTTLVASGDIKVFPALVVGGIATACSGGLVNNFCYRGGSTAINITVSTHLESKSEKNKGTCAGVAANTWYVYSTADGRAGLLCQVGEPDPAAAPFGTSLL